MKMMKQNNYNFSYFTTGRFRARLFGFYFTSQSRMFSDAPILKKKIMFDSNPCYRVRLPSIKNEVDFRRELKAILSDLNPDLYYKLEFSLFLNTNDASKKLFRKCSPYTIFKHKPARGADAQDFLTKKILKGMYLYEGYHTVYSYDYDIKSGLDLDNEVKSVYDVLRDFA